MRAFGIILLTAFLLLLYGCSAKKQLESVFICTGASDDSYHSSSQCRELSKCDGEIGEVTPADALEIGLHPCKSCFPKDSIASFMKQYPGVMK